MSSSRFFIVFALFIIGMTASGQAMLREIPFEQALLKFKKKIPISSAMTASSRDSTIQLERVGGVWVADVEINDLHEAKLVVDTGATITMISEDLAFDAGIQPNRRGLTYRIRGISGIAKEAKMGIVPKIQVGDAGRKEVRVAIYTMPYSSGVDGLLGLSFFDGFMVQLDHSQGLLHLTPKS